MNFHLLHGDAPPVRAVGDYIGSPMYTIIAEHGFAVSVVVLTGLVLVVSKRFSRGATPWPQALWSPYAGITSLERLVFWLMATVGLIHVALIPSHELGWLTVGYAVAGAGQLYIARRVLLRQRWRRLAFWVLSGSLFGYAIVAASGEPPDQVGLATKLLELAVFAVVMTRLRPGRVRRLISTGVVVLAGVVVAAMAWVGAFTGVDSDHHLGEAAQPGTLIPDGDDRPATAHEIEEADELYAATVATASRYADPAVAAADGYNVDGLAGRDFHATNEAYQSDGRIFDPDRPENLIYAVGPAGPVLIGVMYEQEGVGTPGPAIGGPLTVWHAHDHVCFSLTPPALAGLTSPFGVCPLGSITMPMTNEMIHVWTLPGVPEAYGHLEDEWIDGYLDALGG